MNRNSSSHQILVASFSILMALGCGASSPAAESASRAKSGSAISPAPVSDLARAAVAATDRSDADRALDAGRHPAEMMTFFGVSAGQRVAEITAGGGYTTEILARIVGPTGVVYAQNNKFILEKFASKHWSERLAKPSNKNIVRVDRELDSPLPPEAQELDAVINVLFYHDTFWMGTDRLTMNHNIFTALKHGGVYCIVDHSGRPGTGAKEVSSLHRIEEKLVRDEIESEGFKLVAEGNFLRNSNDTRDWNASPMAAGERRGTSDRFVLKFVKP